MRINNVDLDDANCNVVESRRCEVPFNILHAEMGMAGQERHLDADRLESFAKRVLQETI